ncbi:MAG: hypothetical protein Q9226_005098, partial [Calogaya cf. arnoldii]
MTYLTVDSRSGVNAKMHPPYLQLLSSFSFVALAAGELNLLTYATGGLGQVLGSTFGLPGANATFDYVVVGGGTAGLTIATRLASDPSVSVAVIEAGGFYEVDNGNRSVVPGYSSYFTGADPKNYQPLIDWGFVTEPQEGALQRRFHYARGKTLGGSSARNYMIYHRPTVGAMQKWADEVGDQSYTWDNILPFFKKSCNFTSFNKALYNATISQDPSAFDPQGGPLHTSFSNYADGFGSWAQKGFTGVGMELQDGLNSGILNGTSFSTLTIDPRNGYRSSSESSFLQAALQNGTAPMIYKNSLATRLLLDSNNTATRVTVTTAGPYGIPAVNYTLSARKEVIVSAGTFQSPQLLMVSGIGPKEQLERNNIEVKKDLPGVGQNMWDHVLFGISRRVNVLTASASANSAVVAARLAEQFRTNGSGPLAAFGAGIYGWEDLPQPYRSALSNHSVRELDSFPTDWPELEWLPISSFLGYRENALIADPKDGYNYATINPGIIAPLSRGNISINSSEMSTHPIINPNWLTSTTDQELAIQGFKRAREIWKVLEHAGLTVDDGEEYFPGNNVTEDKDILNFIQRSMMTIYHAAGTCKMGKAADKMAVLDSHARVRGVSNLRVVDASSFPILPPGHPQSVIYALAEKIAADILGLDATIGEGYGLGGYFRDQGMVNLKKSSGGSGGSGEEESMGMALSSLRTTVVLMLAMAVSAVSMGVWYKKACDSLRNCPLTLTHPSETQALNGFGPKICERLEQRLKQHCEENGLPMPKRKSRKRVSGALDEATLDMTPTKKPRKSKKPYVPQLRSGAYALILGLSSIDDSECVSRQQLIELAQPHCDASFTATKDTTTFYTAWNSMKTLVDKDLVKETSRPQRRYALTDEGWEVAGKLKKVGKGILDDDDTAHGRNRTAPPSRDPSLDLGDGGEVALRPISGNQSRRSRPTTASYSNHQTTRESNIHGQRLGGAVADKYGTLPSSKPSRPVGKNLDAAPLASKGLDRSHATIDADVPLAARLQAEENNLPGTTTNDLDFIELLSSSPPRASVPAVQRERSARADFDRASTQRDPELLPEPPSRPQVATFVPPTFQPIYLHPGAFTVELILDNREIRSREDRGYIEKELISKGIRPTVRALPLGDFFWVAKCTNLEFLPRHGEEGTEIALDYIIERKRLDDLISSIKDGRFHEQKFRLRRSGVKNVVYLLEDIAISQETRTKYYDAVQSAIASTQVVNGYFMKRTRGIDDTIRYLTRMTRTLKEMYESKPLTVFPSSILSPSTYLPLLAHQAASQSDQSHNITYTSFASLASKTDNRTLRDVFLQML